MSAPDRVLLGHGSGGLMTQRLVREVFLRRLHNPELAALDDAARLPSPGERLALTTDGFVVDPLFFPGGDIGKLAVCGTVNDLLVAGARPVALTAGFILEEGLPLEQLERIVGSMADTARHAGVNVVAGDTKVVPRGKGDGCFITTAGLGLVAEGVELGASRARPGDQVLLTGTAGQHGAAIMASRSGIDLGGSVVSDCAPLSPLVLPLLEQPRGLHVMRDPTRGGVGTTLCELAEASEVTIELAESRLPISEPVRIACDLLGLDPLLLACEGRALIIATPAAADRALRILHSTPAGLQAVAIGEVQQGPARVVLRTAIGGRRLITVPASDPLPRIC